MILLLIVFLFLVPSSYADQSALDSALKISTSKGIVLTPKDEEDLLLKGWRERRTGEFKPPVTKIVRPSDYDKDTKRGTIEFVPSWKNYSYHTVLIPNGTVIDGEAMGACNFTQISPLTDAVVRDLTHGNNLTFKNCNLTNVKTYSDWTIENCNNNQVWRRGESSDEVGTFLDCYNDDCGEKVARSSKDAEKMSKEELDSKKPSLDLGKPSIKVLE